VGNEGEQDRPVFSLLFILAATARLQQDFLTSDEVDQLRQVQERTTGCGCTCSSQNRGSAWWSSCSGREKPGRLVLIHDLLDQYTKIIDAVDTVADDALHRKLDIAKGVAYVADEEKKLLESLRKIRESRPKDAARYQFVLDQAFETTADSMELSSQDVGTRARTSKRGTSGRIKSAKR